MRHELEPEREEELEPAEQVSEEEDEEERDEEAAQRAQARARFQRVAASMEQILAPNPLLRIQPGMAQSDARGLEYLYAAARGDEDGRHVPGITRMKKLNQALAALRPALSAGSDPAMQHERKAYEELAEHVGELRHRITQRIYVEAVGFGGGQESLEDEADGEDDEDDEALSEELARIAESLEIFTDELALAAGKRGRKPALTKLAEAARARLGATKSSEAEREALETELGAVLADPESAFAGLDLEGEKEVIAAISGVTDELGRTPRGPEAVAAAARLLEGVARALRQEDS